MISGDMPILESREDGSVWVHPSSWNGKEKLCGAESAPLGGLVLLEQGKDDWIVPLSAQEGLVPLLQQFMVFPETEEEILRIAGLLERMLLMAPHWKMVNRGGDASTRLLRETLEQLWAKGYANADRLRPDENGLEAVARYIVKQSRSEKQKYHKRWFASRNLKQPKTRTSDTKVSNGKVKRIAGDMLNEARAIMERVYPGYEFVRCAVHGSDVVDGVYIRCVMRRRSEGGGRR